MEGEWVALSSSGVPRSWVAAGPCGVPSWEVEPGPGREGLPCRPYFGAAQPHPSGAQRGPRVPSWMEGDALAPGSL